MDFAITLRTIDNRNYEFSLLPVKKAKKILFIITQLLGPSIGKAMSGLTSLDTDIETEILPLLGNAVSGLTERLNEQELDIIVDTLLPYIKIENEGAYRNIMLDTDFCGQLKSFYKVIFASLEVNFTDFLDGIKPLLKKVKQKNEIVTPKIEVK